MQGASHKNWILDLIENWKRDEAEKGNKYKRSVDKKYCWKWH